MAISNPYQTYKKQSVELGSKKQIVVMLYEGFIKFTKKAVIALDNQNLEQVHLNLTKANRIILELLSSIRDDRGGEIAANLKALYVFIYEQLVEANLEKDKTKILSVQSIMEDMLETWKEVLHSGNQSLQASGRNFRAI